MTRDDLLVVASILKTVASSPIMIENVNKMGYDELLEIMVDNLLDEGEQKDE